MKLLKDIEERLDPSFLLGGPFNGGRHETPQGYREAFPIETNIKIRAASAFL